MKKSLVGIGLFSIMFGVFALFVPPPKWGLAWTGAEARQMITDAQEALSDAQSYWDTEYTQALIFVEEADAGEVGSLHQGGDTYWNTMCTNAQTWANNMGEGQTGADGFTIQIALLGSASNSIKSTLEGISTTYGGDVGNSFGGKPISNKIAQAIVELEVNNDPDEAYSLANQAYGMAGDASADICNDTYDDWSDAYDGFNRCTYLYADPYCWAAYAEAYCGEEEQ